MAAGQAGDGRSLVEWVPTVLPEYRPPWHLLSWCSAIERCLGGGVRALCAVPVRHWKTESTLAGIAWILQPWNDPTHKFILMTHDHERALYLGWRCRQICESTGHIHPERGSNRKDSWRTEEGGAVQVMSAEQSRLGEDVDTLLFDDPLSEKHAFDKVVRDKVDLAIAHYTARVGRPGRPGNVLGVMSRWHEDDPFGRRAGRKARTWELTTDGAVIVNEDGTRRAFAPEVMTLEELDARRAELAEADPAERIWWAQFMNKPKPDDGGGFGDPVTYAMPPQYGRYVIGIDLAYSTESAADYFAMVVLKVWEGVTYVVNVIREKRDLDAAVVRVRQARLIYPNASVWSYVSGPEKGAINYLADRGVPCEGMPARFDKSTRAQTTRDAWNAGTLRVPEQAPWVGGFVRRVKLFTGHPKAFDDDEIDAMVSAYDGGVRGASGKTPSTCGVPRIARY